jgi:hypothetical protein
MSPIQKLQTIMSTIPTITRIPPTEIPPTRHSFHAAGAASRTTPPLYPAKATG